MKFLTEHYISPSISEQVSGGVLSFFIFEETWICLRSSDSICRLSYYLYFSLATILLERALEKILIFFVYFSFSMYLLIYSCDSLYFAIESVEKTGC